MLFTSLDFVIFEFGFRYSRVGIFVFTSLDFGFYKLGFCAIGRLKSCLVPTKLNISRDITASFSLFSFISGHFPVLPAPSRHVHSPLRTNSSPLAYKSTAPNIVFLRPGLTKPSPQTYKFLAPGIQILRPGHTKPSPRTYKLLAPRIKTFSVARKYISKAWKYILKLLKYISKPLK